MSSTDPRTERLIAATLLLLGFLLIMPAVVIGAPNMGADSSVGQAFPFFFDPVWQKYWSAGFAVVTLYGLVVLEAILQRAGDRLWCRLGLVSFTVATALWLIMIAMDENGLPAGRTIEAYFIMLAFPAVIAYGLAILRTGILARWISIAAILWTLVMLIRVFPLNEGPLFYEPALVLIAIALAVSSSPRSATPGKQGTA